MPDLSKTPQDRAPTRCFRMWTASLVTLAATRVAHLTPREAAALELPAGSMAPKVVAGARLTRSGQRWTGIGKLSDALAIIEGRSGTRTEAS